MTAFTILGVLIFWWFCWELGYHIGMYFDAKAGLDALTKPVASDIEVFINWMNEHKQTEPA